MSGGVPRKSATVQHLLTEVSIFVRRFVVLTDDQAVCGGPLGRAYLGDRLRLRDARTSTSTRPRSGRGRLGCLEVLATLVAMPWLTGGTSKAALVRKIDRRPPDAPARRVRRRVRRRQGVRRGAARRPQQRLHAAASRTRPASARAPGSSRSDFDVFGAEGDRRDRQAAGHGRRPLDPDRAQAPGAVRAGRALPPAPRRGRGSPASRTRFISFARRDGFAPLDGAEPELPTSSAIAPRTYGSRCSRSRTSPEAGGRTRSRDAATRLSGEADPDDGSYGVRLLADFKAVFGDARRDLDERSARPPLRARRSAVGRVGDQAEAPRRPASSLRDHEPRSPDRRQDAAGATGASISKTRGAAISLHPPLQTQHPQQRLIQAKNRGFLNATSTPMLRMGKGPKTRIPMRLLRMLRQRSPYSGNRPKPSRRSCTIARLQRPHPPRWTTGDRMTPGSRR